MFRLPHGHTCWQRVAPELARRHLQEVLDVNGGDHSLICPVLAAVRALHAHAFAVLDDELRYWLAGQDDAIVRLNDAPKCHAQHPRAALRHRSARHVIHHRKGLRASTSVAARYAGPPATRETGRLHDRALPDLARSSVAGQHFQPLKEQTLRRLDALRWW